MDLSIVIATRNRASSLARTLDELLKLDNPTEKKIEVIVSDNGSSDATKTICQMFENRFPHFRYIFDRRPGQLVGWHRALLASRSELLAFIDDDVRPLPGWSSAVIECFNNEEVGIATGKILPEFEEKPPRWQREFVKENQWGIWSALWGMLNFGDEIKEISAGFVWGSNFLVRRKALMEAGGFHPGGMPEHLSHFVGDGEVGVGRKIQQCGYKALYNPDAVVAHYLPSARRSDPHGIRHLIFGEGMVTSYILMRLLAEANPSLPSKELIGLVGNTIDPEQISNIGQYYLKLDSKLPDELKKLFQTSGKEGFDFHQSRFQRDDLFRKWVLTPDYLNIDTCYTHPELLAR
ncbi:glycosyltransferase [Rhodospirillales bacterium]|nr:glycosyltransferase [Rhodospirillales bacterium]